MSEHLHLINLFDDGQTEFGISGLSSIEILKCGKVMDRELEITEGMMDDMIVNFSQNVYGVPLQVNLGHDRGGEAAGWIEELQKTSEVGQPTKLKALVSWTPLGVEKVKNKLYRFTSSEIAMEHPHHETGEMCQNVLIGVALTNIPAIKGMNPVTLSEDVQKEINNQSFMELKELFAELNAKQKISAEELQSFKNAAYGKTDAETTSMLDELAGKTEEAPAETTEEVAEEKEEEEAKTDETETTETKDEVVEETKVEEEKAEEVKEESLSEKSVNLAEENKLLKEKLATIELSEKVESDFCLSENKKVGFVKNKAVISKVASFMAKLSQSQRDEFASILSEVKTVDLAVHGTASNSKAKTLEFSEDNVVTLSKELLKSGKAQNITEAQKMAFDQLKK